MDCIGRMVVRPSDWEIASQHWSFASPNLESCCESASDQSRHR